MTREYSALQYFVMKQLLAIYRLKTMAWENVHHDNLKVDFQKTPTLHKKKYLLIDNWMK